MESLQKLNNIDKAFIWYEGQPWLRAVIQAVPHAGSSIDTVLSWRGVHLSTRRVNELFSQISERLQDLEESSLNKTFLRSEELLELLLDCMRVVTRTCSETKRTHVSAFLSDTIIKGSVTNLSQQIIEDLAQLKDFHLCILKALPRSLVPNVLHENGLTKDRVIDLHSLRELCAFDWGTFNKGISDLERFGFICYISEATVWGAGSVEVCRPTRYLNQFREAIVMGP